MQHKPFKFSWMQIGSPQITNLFFFHQESLEKILLQSAHQTIRPFVTCHRLHLNCIQNFGLQCCSHSIITCIYLAPCWYSDVRKFRKKIPIVTLWAVEKILASSMECQTSISSREPNLNNTIATMLCCYMCQCCFSETRWSTQEQYLHVYEY